MDLKEQVQKHEDMINAHTIELIELKNEIKSMHSDFKDGMSRVNESNIYLREQNTRQSEQNTQILNAILEQKNDAKKRDDDFRMMNRSNLWKLILLIGGASSILTFIIDKLIHGM